MVSQNVAAAAAGGSVGGGGAYAPSFSSSPVAATSPSVARGVQAASCSFAALRLLDLVPTPPQAPARPLLWLWEVGVIEVVGSRSFLAFFPPVRLRAVE
jgi:hypothetical protein